LGEEAPAGVTEPALNENESFYFGPYVFNRLETYRGRGGVIPSDAVSVTLTHEETKSIFSGLQIKRTVSHAHKASALYWGDGTLARISLSGTDLHRYDIDNNHVFRFGILIWTEPAPLPESEGYTNIPFYVNDIPITMFYEHGYHHGGVEPENYRAESTVIQVYFEKEGLWYNIGGILEGFIQDINENEEMLRVLNFFMQVIENLAAHAPADLSFLENYNQRTTNETDSNLPTFLHEERYTIEGVVPHLDGRQITYKIPYVAANEIHFINNINALEIPSYIHVESENDAWLWVGFNVDRNVNSVNETTWTPLFSSPSPLLFEEVNHHFKGDEPLYFFIGSGETALHNVTIIMHTQPRYACCD